MQDRKHYIFYDHGNGSISLHDAPVDIMLKSIHLKKKSAELLGFTHAMQDLYLEVKVLEMLFHHHNLFITLFLSQFHLRRLQALTAKLSPPQRPSCGG